VTKTTYYRSNRFDADQWPTDVSVRRGDRRLCVRSHITPAS
jgi:hypothetical protein